MAFIPLRKAGGLKKIINTLSKFSLLARYIFNYLTLKNKCYGWKCKFNQLV